ncbi:MAG: ribosome recycling factor [Tenericutes bacterium GWC2_34_14]|nr:MAG: ribosome recycling factor [Tenericutes bacterium GWA2_35_7]OHE29697.1 MAG: ribosome recycling factor [Tenericutes bacterium GWC2_34_14]OHE34676.1 MAG: ribosome recycling factor [Tenericutes bacterium GWE2_34_108]OHE37463.1 MAG: ribosome recycling factor [Tenericutes bacterium GWF1_35_14]OHE39402.1 MAG: ribosome recycling factor [Tenericutes bacterium GWF2_35_184]OHE44408.1 MAG: ribosome recycling factor [Tenericutes bacterium RIFOXYA2_FULL_36_32]OHE47165.1 MAG: ribosome recycling fact
MNHEQADLILMECEDHMSKTVDVMKKDFASIRTGRANPAILDRITIEYYGAETPLKQVASVSVPEATQLYIKPFDRSVLKAIEHAIQASDIGINPQNDGVGLRMILPPLTEQRRRDLVKEVEKLGEHAKVGIRNVRRDGNEHIKRLGLPEDDEKGYLQDVQDLTDTFVKKVDEEIKLKSEDLLKI